MNGSGSRSSSRAIEVRRLEERYRTLRTFVRAAAACMVAYFAFQAFEKLAGQI